MGWPFTGVERRLDAVRTEFSGLSDSIDGLVQKFDGISAVLKEIRDGVTKFNTDLHDIRVDVPPVDFAPVVGNLNQILQATQGMSATMQQGFQGLSAALLARQ